MKNKKWLWITLTTLLTLIVLIGVAGAGFRLGMTQNASFVRAVEGDKHNFVNGPQVMQGNFKDNGDHAFIQGNSQGRGFNNDRGGDRRRGGMSFFSPIFGLIQLVVLGLLIWVGYKFVKKSGWRLSRVEASPTPEVDETSSVEVRKKKKQNS